MTTVALGIICHNRPAELTAALASTSSDNWDEIHVLDMASDPPVKPVPGVVWHRSEVNLACTGGRNLLAEVSKTDVVAFLDDDAIFLTPAAETIRQCFDADQSLCGLAFRVQRSDGRIRSTEFPFCPPVRKPQSRRACTYFIGCAFALKRSAMLEAGGFDPQFHIHMEELDLAFRLVKAGWTLVYEPSVLVEHHPSPRGRVSRASLSELSVANRIVLVRRHLPVVVAIPHLAIWLGLTFVQALQRRALGAWARGCRAGWTRMVRRSPISWRCVAGILAHGGRILA